MWLKSTLFLLSFCYHLATFEVVNITRDNFVQLVEDSPDIWMINFCSRRNKECKSVQSEFLEASKILERYMKLGFVDVKEQAILTYTFSATNIPRILLFGYDKSHPKDFEGFKTVRGFTTAALKIVEDDINEQIKSRFVNLQIVQQMDEYSLKKLLSANEEHTDWCVVNYSSECHDCLKFSDIFKRLAIRFKHSFNFGAIDVLKHSHDLEKYPQVRQHISEHSVVNYVGDLTYDSLNQWLMDLLPDPSVIQLTSRKIIERTCQNKKYCILASLPNLDAYNSTYRLNLIEDFNKKALILKHLSLGWLWFEVGEQIYLQRLLNLTETGETEFPVFTVVHVKKLIYLQMKLYKECNDVLDKIVGHIMDETDFSGIIEATEFPKIFKVTPWEQKKQAVHKIKTEL